MKSKPTIFVVDDDSDVRGALRWLIESVGLNVKIYSNGRDFLHTYEGERPACLVLDIRMPNMSGLDLQGALVAKGIDIPVIIVTGHGDVQTAVRAMKAGAIDFFEKPFNDQALLDKIQQCLKIDADRLAKQATRAESAARLEDLTPRERTVLDLIAAGHRNKTIANELDISVKTVEFHRAHLMRKLEAASLADLLQFMNVIKT